LDRRWLLRQRKGHASWRAETMQGPVLEDLYEGQDGVAVLPATGQINPGEDGITPMTPHKPRKDGSRRIQDPFLVRFRMGSLISRCHESCDSNEASGAAVSDALCWGSRLARLASRGRGWMRRDPDLAPACLRNPASDDGWARTLFGPRGMGVLAVARAGP
jgi:hypothetical protein